eukprot:1854524-Alexandrium_andersonii.AAC.1
MQAGAKDCTCKAEHAFGKFPTQTWVPGGAVAAAIVPWRLPAKHSLANWACSNAPLWISQVPTLRDSLM